MKGLAINPYVHHSHKAVRARVHLLDAPNIPLSPHCTDNNDNVSKLPTNFHYRSTTSVLIQSVVSILSSMISSTQSCLVSSFTLLQHFLGLNGSMSTLSSTKSSPVFSIRQWFGVKTWSPLGLSLTAVEGLKFSRLSTPMKICLMVLQSSFHHNITFAADILSRQSF